MKSPQEAPARDQRDAQAGEDAPDPRRWIALATLLLAAFMNLIDVTIVNVALPSLQEGLGATSTQIQWVVAGYVLAFALGLLPFGRLGDIIGRRALFLGGVAAFTVCSALCGIAPNIEFLMAARILQGFAGSMMMPQVLAIVQVTFPFEERGTAFSLFGLAAGLASVAGPLVGGLLIGADLWGLDWRPIFLVNVPVGLIAIIAGFILLRRVKPHAGLKMDWIGIIVSGIAVVALVYPLNEGRDYGWPVWAFALMGASVLFAVAFVLWERHRGRQSRDQLLPYSLITNRNYVIGMGMTTAFFSGVPGFFLVLALFLQQGFGLTPFQSGVTTVPFSVGVLIASIVAGRLRSHVLRLRLALGVLVMAAAMIYLYFEVNGLGDVLNRWLLVGPLLIAGFGMGTAIGALFQTILMGVPGRDAGSGSGALQAFQQVGGALGVALMGEIFFTTLTGAFTAGTPGHGAFVSALADSLLYEAGIFVVVALLVPLLRGEAPATDTSQTSGQPGPTGDRQAPVMTEM